MLAQHSGQGQGHDGQVCALDSRVDYLRYNHGFTDASERLSTYILHTVKNRVLDDVLSLGLRTPLKKYPRYGLPS